MYSKIALYIEAITGADVLSSATAFVIELDARLFLVTNWHVLSGRHNETGQCLDEAGGRVPERIRVFYRDTHGELVIPPATYELYEGLDGAIPSSAEIQACSDRIRSRWLEHPNHKSAVDIAALPLADLPPGVDVFPVTDGMFHYYDFFGGGWIELGIGSAVKILGYPIGIERGMVYPIWKEASVAYDPRHNPGGLPVMYVDTATRSGMSGSPVLWTFLEPTAKLDGLDRPRTLLVGVYSARLRADEVKAQVGIVWKTEALLEVISQSAPK